MILWGSSTCSVLKVRNPNKNTEKIHLFIPAKRNRLLDTGGVSRCSQSSKRRTPSAKQGPKPNDGKPVPHYHSSRISPDPTPHTRKREGIFPRGRPRISAFTVTTHSQFSSRTVWDPEFATLTRTRMWTS